MPDDSLNDSIDDTKCPLFPFPLELLQNHGIRFFYPIPVVPRFGLSRCNFQIKIFQNRREEANPKLQIMIFFESIERSKYDEH